MAAPRSQARRRPQDHTIPVPGSSGPPERTLAPATAAQPSQPPQPLLHDRPRLSPHHIPQGVSGVTPNDPYGLSAGVPSGNGPNNPPPTGPNEIWWAPYDPTQVPDGPPGAGFKLGLMYGYFGTTNIFKCAVEPQWQCSFAMNYSTGSPMAQRDSFVTQPSTRIVSWDHRRSPGCSDSRVTTPPRPPWVPFDNTSHYPTRHSSRLNAMFYDGHAAAIKPTDLRVANFREPGTIPAVPGYPGE